jgi:rhodanese-related sulfurtransferase
MKMISVICILVGGGVSCTNNLTEENKGNPSEDVSQTTQEQILENEGTQENVVISPMVVEIPIEKVFDLQQTNSILLIDTRPPIFYKMGHIEGAQSIPLKSFDKNIDSTKSTLDAAMVAGKNIVIYCQNEKCQDSTRMAQSLMSSGYDVRVFKGGWQLWKLSGL